MNWLLANCMKDELHDEAMSCIRVDSSLELPSTFLAFRCPLDKSLTTILH